MLPLKGEFPENINNVNVILSWIDALTDLSGGEFTKNSNVATSGLVFSTILLKLLCTFMVIFKID